MTLLRKRARAGERWYDATCKICSAVFRCRSDRPQKYCSHACSAIGHTKPRQVCERCGTLSANRKHSRRRFCGRTCAAAATVKQRPTCHVCGVTVTLGAIACIRHNHAAKRDRRARECPTCQQTFVPRNAAMGRADKYCSRDCYRVVQKQRPAMIEVPCAQCGTVFRRTQAAIHRNEHSFCSRACTSAFNSAENSASWRGGKQPGYRGPGWPRLAETIRERDGYRCRRCGKHQDEEVTSLSVDHIIPYRSFESRTEANDPTNLVALCRVCHGKKNRAERRWLRGDVMEMWQYQIAVAQPWTVPS